MTTYVPDKWIVLKISSKDYPTVYKVFACWYGGYTGNDCWKLNSGVTSVTKEGKVYSFFGASGSVYTCHADSYGTHGYGSGVLQHMIEQAAGAGISIEILAKETDWGVLDWHGRFAINNIPCGP